MEVRLDQSYWFMWKKSKMGMGVIHGGAQMTKNVLSPNLGENIPEKCKTSYENSIGNDGRIPTILVNGKKAK